MLIQFISQNQYRLSNSLFAVCLAALVSSCAISTSKQEVQKPVAPQAQAAYQRAVLAMKSGQTKRAFKLFNSISKKYPRFSGPQINIGLMYLKKNKLKKAESAFKRAIQINRDNAVGYNLLGVVYRRSGKFNEAMESYKKALSKDSEYANAHLNIGVLYDIYMDDLKRAVHHYEQYQKFAKIADKKVAKWILDLKRRAQPKTSKSDQAGGRKQG